MPRPSPVDPNRNYEKLARIVRKQTERIRRVEQEREKPGTVQQLRRVSEEPTDMNEELTVTILDDPYFVWGESDWGFADWGP